MLRSQFGNPHGLIGQAVGRYMERDNSERLDWALQVFDPQSDDRILEVGFGPGLSIQRMAEMVTEGWIAGIDISELMLAQAIKRNRAAIEAGRVELKQASVEQIPYPDAIFNKALVINSLHHWPAPEESHLVEVRRVLVPGGSVSIVEQPRWVNTKEQLVDYKDELIDMVRRAGFASVVTRYKQIKSKPCLCLKAYC